MNFLSSNFYSSLNFEAHRLPVLFRLYEINHLNV